MKMLPMTYRTQRSDDPSVPLMKIVNEGSTPEEFDREYLRRSFNLSEAAIDRLLEKST